MTALRDAAIAYAEHGWKVIPASQVCQCLGVSRKFLCRVLHICGAPRPAMHHALRQLVWTENDVEEMATFIGRSDRSIEIGGQR